jgi:hypothetical protein
MLSIPAQPSIFRVNNYIGLPQAGLNPTAESGVYLRFGNDKLDAQLSEPRRFHPLVNLHNFTQSFHDSALTYKSPYDIVYPWMVGNKVGPKPTYISCFDGENPEFCIDLEGSLQVWMVSV